MRIIQLTAIFLFTLCSLSHAMVSDIFPPVFNNEQLLVNQAGMAVLLSEEFDQDDSWSLSATVSLKAIDANGEQVWQKNLDEMENHNLGFSKLDGNNLLMIFYPSFSFGPDGLAESDSPEAKLVSLNTLTGATNWTTNLPDGHVTNLSIAGNDMYYLRYNTWKEQTIENHLAGINSSGAIAWDIITSTITLPPIAEPDPDNDFPGFPGEEPDFPVVEEGFFGQIFK